jgi:hypothetical protein
LTLYKERIRTYVEACPGFYLNRDRKMWFHTHIFLEAVIGYKQGRKRPLDTPKRIIERRQREGEREKER